jgi:hypothetical protein
MRITLCCWPGRSVATGHDFQARWKLEIGKCHGVEMNVEKTKVMKISKQPSPIQIVVDQKQPENVEYFSYLGSVVTNDVRCTSEIKSRIGVEKAAFNEKTALFTSKLDLNLRKELVNCYI